MATRTDTFDRANSSNIGADWAEDVGGVSISSNNLVRGSGVDYAKTRWVGTALDSNDYYVEVVGRSADYASGVGPAARCATSATNTYYGYIIFGGDRAYLIEITAGGENILDTGGTITANTNYTLRIEVNGSTIRGYLNGVLDCEATDASLASGAPGVCWYGGSSGTYITTWTASDLAAAAASIIPAAFGRELHARGHANLRR